MTIDIELEQLELHLERLYVELSQKFNEDEMKSILDNNTGPVRFGNIHAFMKEPLNHLFFYSSIKCILSSLIIIKEQFKTDPNHNKYLNELFKRWKI